MATVMYPQGNVLLRNLKKSFPLVSHGQGIYLFDTDGKRYLDASGGAMVVSVGHGQKELAQEIAEQMGKVAYVNGTQFTSPVMEEVATRLSKLAPGALNRVALLASGSEAIEAAVKFIRQLWVERGQAERSVFIARSPGYHGNTLFALSASARPHYKKFFGPLLSDVEMIEAPYEYRSPVDYESQGADYYAQKLEEKILALGAHKVAAFIAEPVIGSSAGASAPPPGYFEKVQAICRKHGILILADEVLCGSGRTGKFFASEHFNLEPDVVVLGKGINGGLMPVSALIVKDSHLEEMKNGSGAYMHAQTYLQVPSAAATVLAVLKFFEKNSLVKNSETTGAYLHEKLRAEILPLKNVGHTTGLGLLAGVEFVEDKNSKAPFPRGQKVIESFLQHASDRGLILWSNTGHANGVDGDLVMIAPPLIITHPQVDELVGLLKDCIQSFF